MKTITISNDITKIGNEFSNRSDIEEIIIPNSVTCIESGAFKNCTNLKRIIIPDSVTFLGENIFSGCINLEEVVLPKTITHLPNGFFQNCKHLNITLPPNITSLGSGVFENCINLTHFPQSVTSFKERCFKNCRKLQTVSLNENITELPDSSFEDCKNLIEISFQSDKKIPIGKKCFKNCLSLKTIPSFIDSYNEQSFENCQSITELSIISEHIPFACFRNCKKLKKIHDQDKITSLSSYAFSGCENLEEIILSHPTVIPAEAFNNCKRLKVAKINPQTTKIESKAFYNCNSLETFYIPDNIETIKNQAFENCHSLSEITIPKTLKHIGKRSFSHMSSLERITVSPENQIFISPDGKILIDKTRQRLLLYSSGNKNKSYSLRNYNINVDIFGREIIKPILAIDPYAFAGAKNLEELTLCTCTSDIDITAFEGCNNLKTLNINGITFYSVAGIKLRENGKYYFKSSNKEDPFIPFETVNFTGDIIQIHNNALSCFKKVKQINLPEGRVYQILPNAFSDCTNLSDIYIPENIKDISENALPPNTKVHFPNNLTFTNLISFHTITENCRVPRKQYTLGNKTYYIDRYITEDEIKEVCLHPEEILKHPAIFVDFIEDLENNNFYIPLPIKRTLKQPAIFVDFTEDLKSNDLYIPLLLNGILMSSMNMEARNLLFQNCNKNDSFFLEVLQKSGILDEKDEFTEYLLKHFDLVTEKIKILKKYNIKNPELCNKVILCLISNEDFEKLINLDLDLFIQIIRASNLQSLSDKNNPYGKITEYINGLNKQKYDIVKVQRLGTDLISLINILKETNQKDPFLMNILFIRCINNPLCKKLIKNFDKHIKRAIKSSNILSSENEANKYQNFKDLLNLLEMTGGLEEDTITRQKACTFITEKILEENLSEEEKNNYRISGDDIHRVFNFSNKQTNYDPEFAEFFLDNYHELYKIEKETSGSIQRIYESFKDISETSTSNKGFQRKLKVTVQKCLSYLAKHKFEDVKDGYEDLAILVGKWFDSKDIWNLAQSVHEESLDAPRNIFTKTKTNEDGKLIYDNNPNNDLKEELSSNYSFEWLPKQEYDNIVLGKYCSCCSHAGGAGNGIMRASMILDNCQNLVVRNEKGTIIAKATIAVNKEKGYAVYNTFETSLNNRSESESLKIYAALIRGTKAFIETYNQNNPTSPINIVTVGTNSNTLLMYLKDEVHPVIPVLPSISYGAYSLNSSSNTGDWTSRQKLVMKIN